MLRFLPRFNDTGGNLCLRCIAWFKSLLVLSKSALLAFCTTEEAKYKPKVVLSYKLIDRHVVEVFTRILPHPAFGLLIRLQEAKSRRIKVQKAIHC